MKVNSNEVLLNFQAADIQAVVKAMSQMTNRNFLLDPRVKGQITIISAKPVPRAAAYQIFLSALKAQGFTAVEGPGGLVKVIPIAEAKQSAEVNKDTPRGGEQMVTHVAILQNVSPTQIVPILRPLMAPTSQLSAYEAANALVLTDYADNVRRMLGIIDRIDQPISSEVTVVPLKNASALDLADLIARLAAPAGGVPGVPVQVGAPVAGDRFTIIPDLRTNSLLVRTENPGRLAQLQSLISKLDVPATTGGQTRVIYLRNAEAVKLADVLRGLLAGEARSQQQAAPAAGGVPGVVGRPVGAARSGAEASLVQADEATNSLIINASDAVYNNLRAVIEKLDVRRAQVFVEALIAEITTDNAFDLGFQWAAASGAGQGGVAGFTNLPNPQNQGSIAGAIADPKSLGLLKGFQVAFLGRQIQLPDGTTVRSIGALARALESKNLANILSTPNLLTLDNAEAKIIVGQNVPFVTGSFLTAGAAATATTGANPFQTIDRKDIGIQLKIKPQISEGGGVKLDIFQEISTVTAPPAGVTAADIITNKRSVETKVLVDDGSTVVLGGLIEDRISETRSQVPFLGRIPLLGALFRSTSESKQKTNLMIFLKPTIIRTVEGNYRVATDRYDYIRAQGVESEGVPQLDRLRPAPPPKAPEPEKEKEKERPGSTTPSAEQRDPR
jgi:general secretion pathway protein D